MKGIPQLTLEEIAAIRLDHGEHSDPDHGHCLLEVVSMFAGEEFTDRPACVDPVLAQFGIGWNDGMRSDDEREQLKRYITRLPGTNVSPALSEKRSWMAFDWLIRVHLAAWLALTPALAPHSEALKALSPIVSKHDLDRAKGSLDKARAAARAAAWDAARAAAWAAAWDAAWDAARDAAWDAARAAAWDAARAAARDAAWDAAGAAAWAAARDAAGAAARAAARDALEPTVRQLQASAHELFNAMIDAEAD